MFLSRLNACFAVLNAFIIAGGYGSWYSPFVLAANAACAVWMWRTGRG
jgi:hypothetical protein